MTPRVREILDEARAAVHAALRDVVCIQDTQVLFTLDQLIIGDEARHVKGILHDELVAETADESSRPTEKIVKPEAPKHDDDPDGRLIRGLLEENQRLKAELQRKREGGKR